MASFFNISRIVASLCLIVAAPTALALSAPPRSGQAAVLFDPGLSQAQMLVQISSAGAELVRFGQAPGLAIVALPEQGPAPLRGAGAWLVFDPLVLGGCGPASQTPSLQG